MQEQLDRAIEWMQAALERTPWAATGLLLATATALLLAYPLGKLLRSNPIIVGLLLGAFGFALVFTLTPTPGAAYNVGSCYSRFAQPSRADLIEPTDLSLNILLFLPAGVLIMLLRPVWAVMAVAIFALLMPPVIEYVQLSVVELNRTCSFLDVATNELGLLVGLAVGAIIRVVWEIARAITNRVRT